MIIANALGELHDIPPGNSAILTLTSEKVITMVGYSVQKKPPEHTRSSDGEWSLVAIGLVLSQGRGRSAKVMESKMRGDQYRARQYTTEFLRLNAGQTKQPL